MTAGLLELTFGEGEATGWRMGPNVAARGGGGERWGIERTSKMNEHLYMICIGPFMCIIFGNIQLRHKHAAQTVVYRDLG